MLPGLPPSHPPLPYTRIGQVQVVADTDPKALFDAIMPLPVSGTSATVRRHSDTEWEEELEDGATTIHVKTTEHAFSGGSGRIVRELTDKAVKMTARWTATVQREPDRIGGGGGQADKPRAVAVLRLEVDLTHAKAVFKPFMRVVFTVLGGRTSGLKHFGRTALEAVGCSANGRVFA